MRKTIKMSYDDWNDILHELVTAGKEFYEFYADIEDALYKHEAKQIAITLHGSKDSFKVFENRGE